MLVTTRHSLVYMLAVGVFSVIVANDHCPAGGPVYSGPCTEDWGPGLWVIEGECDPPVCSCTMSLVHALQGCHGICPGTGTCVFEPEDIHLAGHYRIRRWVGEGENRECVWTEFKEIYRPGGCLCRV